MSSRITNFEMRSLYLGLCLNKLSTNLKKKRACSHSIKPCFLYENKKVQTFEHRFLCSASYPVTETMTANKDYGRTMKHFSLKSRIFGLGQTNQADKFWGIWGIFCQTISTHFGRVSPLSMFSIIQPLFLQKTKPLYPHPKYLFGIGI